jgi:hypothetical protein
MYGRCHKHCLVSKQVAAEAGLEAVGAPYEVMWQSKKHVWRRIRRTHWGLNPGAFLNTKAIPNSRVILASMSNKEEIGI